MPTQGGSMQYNIRSGIRIIPPVLRAQGSGCMDVAPWPCRTQVAEAGSVLYNIRFSGYTVHLASISQVYPTLLDSTPSQFCSSQSSDITSCRVDHTSVDERSSRDDFWWTVPHVKWRGEAFTQKKNTVRRGSRPRQDDRGFEQALHADCRVMVNGDGSYSGSCSGFLREDGDSHLVGIFWR